MTLLRLAGADAVGRAAGGLSARLGRGRGETLRGRVLLALEPRALALLSRGRDIVLVSGTNGKTTTTSYLAALAAQASGEGVSTSLSGANMPAGIAAALAAHPRHRIAVLECDEMYLPAIIGQVSPRVIVLLNLSRDQLHRTGEVRKVAQLWHEALAASPATVVIDRDDPFLEHAVAQAPRVTRVSFGGRRHLDAATCPACGQILDWSGGDYHCPCGLGQQEPDQWAATDLLGPQRNAVLAVAALAALGYPVAPDAARQVVASAPDRVAVYPVSGRQVPTRLAKNPESWRGALAAVTCQTVVLAVNSRGIDGRDMSWLWDVDYRSLVGRHVIATGDRGLDLAYRLHVQGIQVSLAPDMAAAVTQAPVGSLEAIASYTAFQDLASAAAGIHAVSGGRS